MTDPLFIVENTFTIERRGLVLIGIALEQYGTVAVGDRVSIRRPDGSIVHAEVRGVEYPPSVKYIGKRPANPRYGVMVDLHHDISLGSVVTPSSRPDE